MPINRLLARSQRVGSLRGEWAGQWLQRNDVPIFIARNGSRIYAAN